MRNSRHWTLHWTWLAATLLLAGCAGTTAVHPSSWHLPWRRPPVPAPLPVFELPIDSSKTPGVAVTQYWYRNALRLDLGAVPASGVLRVLPNEVDGWPVRLEFAVRSGTMSQLEVRGDQRAVFTITPATGNGGQQVLALSPSVYSRATTVIFVSWN